MIIYFTIFFNLFPIKKLSFKRCMSIFKRNNVSNCHRRNLKKILIYEGKRTFYDFHSILDA